MIGFVTTQVEAQQVNDVVANAQISRELPVFWLPGQYKVYRGEHEGLFFIPCDNETLNTPLRGNPPSKPIDFPEFQVLIGELGGMDARVNVSPESLTPSILE